ncbi:MAG: type II toxin-antitoxin system VapC family toxin [Deltaproteobacteria bacterium]|nr:type II toxin-antitoxin system VapC family toxin [Deltaproteobacteria bacterium]
MENTLTVSLLDTNILVYANNEDSPFHIPCKALVEKAINSQIRAAIAIQNLIELYAVITDKRRVEHPLSPLKAKELIDFYKDQEAIQGITPTSQTFNTVTELIAKHKPKAQSIFDYLLAATMIDNGVYEIYTANSDHFKPFSPTIKTINPLKN